MKRLLFLLLLLIVINLVYVQGIGITGTILSTDKEGVRMPPFPLETPNEHGLFGTPQALPTPHSVPISEPLYVKSWNISTHAMYIIFETAAGKEAETLTIVRKGGQLITTTVPPGSLVPVRTEKL
jgi:hypothetical protein